MGPRYAGLMTNSGRLDPFSSRPERQLSTELVPATVPNGGNRRRFSRTPLNREETGHRAEGQEKKGRRLKNYREQGRTVVSGRATSTGIPARARQIPLSGARRGRQRTR